MIGLPGKTKTFSTPPVSFQSINFFVGGARSRAETMSDVSESCSFMVSLGMPFCSSTISLRFRLPFLSVPVQLKKFIATCKQTIQLVQLLGKNSE